MREKGREGSTPAPGCRPVSWVTMSLRLRRHVATLGVMTVALAAGALAAAHPLGADPPVPSAAAAAAVAPVAGGADDIPPPAQDAFYQAPSPLPAGEPGTITVPDTATGSPRADVDR